ncbi:hypothetical protein TIFTF001_052892 [Ficus carica]|uniref:Uncharacterized protein n=1 Tax=Ficus carica TaxID=3494 RepID=A0AA88ELX4_FICCA|nr:hypothetical protein TIFTF001_052889 [Ficus carica]GMN72671.1 hypothetical protein TIFTF001_052890 [Ficus carica]GMN72674.1 hypothetical protein TIFTF001_052891 [Ficus carica]GMN72680.1 hypothetical protein TIFTF001_052892 [Ficus carica]
MIFKIIICAVQEKARKRDLPIPRAWVRAVRCGSGVGGGRWISRKRLEGGVVMEIGGERERGGKDWRRGKEGETQEIMEGGVTEEEMGFEGEIGGESE